MNLTLEEVKQHVSGDITDDMQRFAKDEVFGELQTIFVKIEGKGRNSRRVGHCTHCGSDFDGGGLIHKERIICPHCGCYSRVYFSWYSRKYFCYYGYMMYWQKSQINPDVVTAVGISLKLDMSGAIALDGIPKIEFYPEDMFVFIPGKGSARYSHVWHNFYYAERLDNWSKMNAVTSQTAWWSSKCDSSKCADYTFREAVTGTPFERMGVLEYDHGDGIECVDLAARWPSFEYLHKMGFSYLIKKKMYGYPTYGAVRWRGKSLKQVLGMTKSDVKELKSKKIQIGFKGIYILRRMRENGLALNVAEAQKIAGEFKDFGKKSLEAVFNAGDPRRLLRYYREQMEEKTPDGRRNYYSNYGVHHDYVDYLEQCHQLQLDTCDSAIKWPKNLNRAHENLTKQIQYKQNAELEQKTKERAKKLKRYEFSYNGLVLRPFCNGSEIINEGKALSHCVGGYVRSYAEGRTILCALRHEDDLDTPWHTVEFSPTDGRLVQCRGNHNRTEPEDRPLLEEFWKAFEEYRAKKVRKTA